MGSYIAKADVLEQVSEEILVQLTDDEGIGAANDSRVNAAIDNAEGEADGYLSTRYPVPLAPVPGVVKKFCADIAIYNLFSRRDTVPEERGKRYENAVKFFRDVSKGLVSLGTETPPPANSGPEFSGPDRVFTKDTLEDF